MTIQEIALPESDERPPDRVEKMIADAHARIDQFTIANMDDPIISFVASDYTAVYNALRHIQENHLATGNSFCEWGSGMGICACLAAFLGFDAYGIEIVQSLVDESNRFRDDYELPNAQFTQGSFLPDGCDWLSDSLDDLSWLDFTAPDAYDEIGLNSEDFDVLFIYPWPGEERFVEDLFEHTASTGTLLLSYHGVNEIRLRRRT